MRVYSALLLLALGACSFSPGTLGSDGSVTGDDDAPDIDATGMVDPDARPDGLPPAPGNVRSIDITDAQVAGASHVDFPLLISLSSQTWLRSTGNGGDVARTDGFDIYFASDQAGVTRLAHEVEAFDPVTGTLVAWVKVALTPQTVLFIHYGDPAITTSQESVTQVWSGGYELVVHLAGGGDATSKNTLVGTLTQATGQIGPARSFDGSTSNGSAGSQAAIDNVFTGGGTVEGWFFATGFGENSLGRLFDKGNTDGFSLFIDNVNRANTLTFAVGCSSGLGQGLWMMPSAANILNTWHHIAVVYNKDSAANDPIIYFDGVSVAVTENDTPSGTIDSDAASELYFGNNPAFNRTFAGTLDELRLSSVTRTTDWIATQYRNQDDPGAFYTVGNPL